MAGHYATALRSAAVNRKILSVPARGPHGSTDSQGVNTLDPDYGLGAEGYPGH
jgi:hypothetical protein